MYDDTILPIRTKFRVPSRSRARIYFVRDKTKESLFYIKWIELVLSLICLTFVIVAVSTAEVQKLDKIIVVLANSSSVLIVLAEITYQYIKRSFTLIGQILCSVINFALFCITTTLTYRMENNHDLIKTLFFLNEFASVMFMVDIICKIIISTYLYQTTRVKSVVDVAVSAIFPPPPPGNKPKHPPHRSVLTTTPITYGGTFPIGKDQPPFLAEERMPPDDVCQTPDRGVRTRTAQTPPFYMEGRRSSALSFSVGTCTYSAEGTTKGKFVQTYLEHDEKATSTVPTLHAEEERRKKSPWTCSTPTNSRKLEARKHASMSTPITYSGTFAVNKELVPITPGSITGTSPKSSPRSAFSPDKSHRKNTTNSRSEGNSPVRSDNIFLELERLDQISEEKISQLSSENDSVRRSTSTFFDSSMLPGSVIEESDDRRNFCYDVR